MFGRKRCLATDTLGLIHGVSVGSAGEHDTKAAEPLIQKMKGKFKRLKKLLADQGFGGDTLRKLVTMTLGALLEIVKPGPKPEKTEKSAKGKTKESGYPLQFEIPGIGLPAPEKTPENPENKADDAKKVADAKRGFSIEPFRWIVERTNAWTIFTRRLAKDYEHNPKSSEAMILLSAIRRNIKNIATLKLKLNPT